MERLKQSNAGAVLAIIAGVFTLAVTTFPSPTTQSDLGDVGAFWSSAVHVLGTVIAGAPFLASLRPRLLWLSKAVLVVSGLLLIGSGFLTGVVAGAGPAPLLLDAVPGVLAIIAAALLRPLRRPEVERARRATEAGRARRAS